MESKPDHLPPARAGDITRLLWAWQQGNQDAYGDLFEKVYPLLYQKASWALHKMGKQSLQPTELVHEVYMNLVNAGAVKWSDRVHFLAVAAKAIHECLVDHITRKARLKRGGDQIRISLSHIEPQTQTEVDLLALHQALDKLKSKDARQFQVVECRFFGGLTVRQTALALGMSPRSVDMDWSMARAWLFGQLFGEAR